MLQKYYSLKTSLFVAIILIVTAMLAPNANAQVGGGGGNLKYFLVQKSLAYGFDQNILPGQTNVNVGGIDIYAGDESIMIDYIEMGVEMSKEKKVPLLSLKCYDGLVQLGYTASYFASNVQEFWQQEGRVRLYGIGLVVPAHTTKTINFVADFDSGAQGRIKLITSLISGSGLVTGETCFGKGVPIYQNTINVFVPDPPRSHIALNSFTVAQGSKYFELPIYFENGDIETYGLGAVINLYDGVQGNQRLHGYTGFQYNWKDYWWANFQGDFRVSASGNTGFLVAVATQPLPNGNLGNFFVGLNDNTQTGDSIPINFSWATVNDTGSVENYWKSYIKVGPEVVWGDMNVNNIFSYMDLQSYLAYLSLPSTPPHDTGYALLQFLSGDLDGNHYIDYRDLQHAWMMLYYQASPPIANPPYCGGIIQPPRAPISGGYGLVPTPIVGGGLALVVPPGGYVTSGDIWVSAPQNSTITPGPGITSGSFHIGQRDSLGRVRIVFATDSIPAGMTLITIANASVSQIEVGGNVNSEYTKVSLSSVMGTGDETQNSVPTEFALKQNYPNPFNPTTTISFALPEAGLVTLKVYDVLGQEVATLVNKDMEAGEHQIQFDAAELPSGVYTYRLTAGTHIETKKMILMK